MELSQSLRMDQRQLLTPRMIQSMEILQLPLAALEERIEQELQNNPVLELREPDGQPIDGEPVPEQNNEAREEFSEGEQTLVVQDRENSDGADFERLEKISEYLENEDYGNNTPNYRAASSARR